MRCYGSCDECNYGHFKQEYTTDRILIPGPDQGHKKYGPHRTVPDRTEPYRTVPSRTKPDRNGPDRAGPLTLCKQWQPDQTGPTDKSAGSDRTDAQKHLTGLNFRLFAPVQTGAEPNALVRCPVRCVSLIFRTLLTHMIQYKYQRGYISVVHATAVVVLISTFRSPCV